MGVGQIIDGAIKLYRRNFRALITIVAAPLVPLALLEAFLLRNARPTSPTFDPNTTPTFSSAFQSAFPGRTLAVLGVFVVLHYLIVTPLLVAAVSRASADAYLGRPPTAGDVLRAALRRAPWVLATILVITLCQTVPAVLLVLPAVVARNPALLVLGILAAIPAVFFLYFRLILAPVTVMLEGRRAVAAAGRAWRLTRGAFWRTVGILVLAGLIAEVAGVILGLTGTLLGSVAGSLRWVPMGVLAAVGSVLTAPFITIVQVLLYFDLRIRKEGFDLALLAQQLQA